MQQNVPNQAIHVVEAPNEKANLKDGCYTKAATVLGVLHIICGVISLAAEIALLNVDSSWNSTIFFIMPGGPVSILFFSSPEVLPLEEHEAETSAWWWPPW